jgi:hypothetical protein
VFPREPGAPVAPVLGATVPTAQGPTLNSVLPVLSAKNIPGWELLKFTAGCPAKSKSGSGLLFRISERRTWMGVEFDTD